jgi:hypothetical protein
MWNLFMFLKTIRTFFITFFFICTFNLFSVNPSSQSIPLYKVGDYAEGGVIFWLTPDGKHGLVASIEDMSENPMPWAPSSSESIFVRAAANYLGFGKNYTTAGKENTETITTAYGDGVYAAKACANYSHTTNGINYDDWYLPCLLELGLMMTMRETIESVSQANGGDPFEDSPYWSSFEALSSKAWVQSFGDAFQKYENKGSNYRVRAVRAF